MKTEIMIAVLALLCIGSLAAAFVLWAKLDEQKQKTADEHANYLAALNLHNATALELERSKVREECSAKAILWNAEKLIESHIHGEMLQNRLSSLLCPHNDHVWKDGRCAKCGRAKNALP